MNMHKFCTPMQWTCINMQTYAKKGLHQEVFYMLTVSNILYLYASSIQQIAWYLLCNDVHSKYAKKMCRNFINMLLLCICGKHVQNTIYITYMRVVCMQYSNCKPRYTLYASYMQKYAYYMCAYMQSICRPKQTELCTLCANLCKCAYFTQKSA